LVLPLKILVLFIAAFPLTILFSANWYMAYSSFKLGFEAFLLIGLIISNFAYVSVAMKLISSFFTPKIDESLLETFDHKMPILGLRKYQFYLISFWALILLICLVSFASGLTNDLSLRFASYLLSI